MKKVLKNVGLFGLAVLACLVVGEVIVSIVAPQQLLQDPDIYIRDKKLGMSHIKNLNIMFNHGEGLKHIVTDKYGYRINCSENPICSEDNPDVSILAIGDSYMEALSIENEETIPEVLGSYLNAKYGVTVYIANTGVVNRNPNHYLLETRRALSRQEFDFGIVLLYLGNDFITRVDTVVNPKHTYSEKTRTAKIGSKRWLLAHFARPVKHFLESNSHLFVLFKHTVYTLLNRMGKTMGYLPAEFCISNKRSITWEATADACGLIRDEFAYRGIQVLFIFVPTPWQVREESFYAYVNLIGVPLDSVDLEQPNKMLASALDSRSINYFDPLLNMRARADEGIRQYGKIDKHLSAMGHETIAKSILPYCEECLKPILEDRVNSP